MPTKTLRSRRETIVREHMEAENRLAFDAALAEFDHPHYELIALGEIYDGADQVHRYYAETRTAFPDQRNELTALYHADNAVIVEFDLKGTHIGPYRGVPPTGRSFTCRMTALFLFDGDRLTTERVYFDSATILRQLGLAHDPLTPAGRIATALTHPVTLARAFTRQFVSRGRPRRA